MSFIGKNIIKQRTKAGLTQKELAKKAGMTPQQLSQYETGSRSPRYETAEKIARAIGCRTEDITEGLILDTKTMYAAIQNQLNYALASDMSAAMFDYFRRLNETGQTKTIDYARDISQIPAYQAAGVPDPTGSEAEKDQI